METLSGLPYINTNLKLDLQLVRVLNLAKLNLRYV